MNPRNERKKELQQEYKERKVTGGVYKITCTGNGRYYLDMTLNPEGMKNRFEFGRQSNTCTNLKMTKDWNTFGAGSFVFEILEKIERKESQSPEEFKEDLKLLLEIQADRFDPVLRY